MATKIGLLFMLRWGAWAMNSNRKLYFMSSLKLPDNYIKGSVGAGDAFCAGMLLCLYRGIAMEEALKIANAAAASNLAAMDSVSGMKALDEVKELYKKFGFPLDYNSGYSLML